MTRTCDQLGVCNGRHCTNVAACPDYDLLACNSMACLEHDSSPMLCPHADRRLTDRAPLPTYPFAPGVIQGPELPIFFMDDDGPWFPLSAKATLKLLGTMVALAMLAGYLVERFA